MTHPTRGILYPARLPSFERVEAPAAVAESVAWFWIPRWQIDPGRTSRQHVLAHPASNLVVESPSPSHPGGFVGLAGPTSAHSHRDLVGTGWAVGAQLRPAGASAFATDLAQVRDRYVEVVAPELLRSVIAAMTTGAGADVAGAVEVFAQWVADRVGEVGDDARLANRAVDLLVGDPGVERAEEVAAVLAISTRTLQRLTARHVGLPPAALIRRRRLQEAAERVRTDPSCDLARLAAELGYADQGHLARDFRQVLMMSPSEYRQAR